LSHLEATLEKMGQLVEFTELPLSEMGEVAIAQLAGIFMVFL
jgi:hypothetical protein